MWYKPLSKENTNDFTGQFASFGYEYEEDGYHGEGAYCFESTFKEAEFN
jgi:hypothetical protein